MTFFSTQDARPLASAMQAPAGSVTDKDLLAVLRGYKRGVASRYRAIVGEELTEFLPAGALRVSRKIDGELWFLMLDPASSQAVLISPKGRVIYGDMPVLEEAKVPLAKVTVRTIIAGEFFAANDKKIRPRVGDLAKALGGEAKAQVGRVAFAAFDLVLGGEGDTTQAFPPYAERQAVLETLLEGGKRLRAVQTTVVGAPAEAAALYEEWVAGGKGEGLVIRAPDETIYKAKPSINLDAAIVGYTESSEGPDKVGSLLLGLMREGGQFQLIGSCGNMPTEQRLEFMKVLPQEHCDCAYRYANSRGALYHFIAPTRVVEVKLTDVQSLDSSGDPIQRMVLDYRDGKWTAVRQMAGASILHPVFVRVRLDKSINETDIRAAQVLERCVVPELAQAAAKVDLPTSEVLRREVYTKTVKTKVAVRKLVVWKTNKQETDASYPAYVVHWTDYSVGRKDPLKRDVRLAADEASAQSIADGLIAKNIKKGWAQA